MSEQGRRILLGRVLGAFGLRGEVKFESWTEPRSALFRYQPWILRFPDGSERELRGARGRESGKYLIGHMPDVLDRDAAEALHGTEIHVPRDALPPAKPGEYYWVDLEGLRVVNAEGTVLGVVSHLFATGANDVMVVRDEARERMIPFVQPRFVTGVDFESGTVSVDWDPDF
ncbi:ribosome maturation factor RimM [Lysobacter sp. SG-8]|uniref:Ribosome maturation factor RimM n=1 Tax=Marilutibacter penaei TaxID=2759900 RepID=A0A7W3YDP2_9GAMM|nr:ribosome maturation factor RimM [Lysobacter penaei]MBB1087376.1 ribosome maturation factor RimM [Lysobacter penaei]